jgi:MtN3 and saliva related transmembrane protein
MSVWVETIGSVAAILTTACYLPQVFHTYKTRDVAGISLMMYLFLLGGVVCWLVYGVLRETWPLVVSNLITIAMLASIITMKLKFGKPKQV